MERHHSKTIAPTPVCRELPSNRDSDEMAGNPSTSDSVDRGFSDSSAPFNDQPRAIRRKLWIFKATLESLHAKIEMAYHLSGARIETDTLDRSVHTCDGLANDGFALKGKKILASWPARWKCARLRARAVRAERHAAVAMNNAAASLSHAFEAVLEYTCARAKADESCRNITRASPSRDCS